MNEESFRALIEQVDLSREIPTTVRTDSVFLALRIARRHRLWKRTDDEIGRWLEQLIQPNPALRAAIMLAGSRSGAEFSAGMAVTRPGLVRPCVEGALVADGLLSSMLSGNALAVLAMSSWLGLAGDLMNRDPATNEAIATVARVDGVQQIATTMLQGSDADPVLMLADPFLMFARDFDEGMMGSWANTPQVEPPRAAVSRALVISIMVLILGGLAPSTLRHGYVSGDEE